MVRPDHRGEQEVPLERQTYLDERDLLIDAEREAARTFDKCMISLSGAALGLSITFVRYIAPSPRCILLLCIAWLCFSLAVIVTLSSFLTAQSAIRKQRDILDEYYEDEVSEKEKRNRWATATKCLNVTSIVLFICGVVFFACFSIRNLPRGDEAVTKQRSHVPLREGYAPPSPPAKPQPQTTQPPTREPPPPPAEPSRPSEPAKK